MLVISVNNVFLQIGIATFVKELGDAGLKNRRLNVWDIMMNNWVLIKENRLFLILFNPNIIFHISNINQLLDAL